MLKTVSSILILLFLSFLPAVSPGAEENNVTPYGDYCKDCTIYGTCKEVIPTGVAVAALDRYYRDRGYRVGTVQYKGRFIEAVIYKRNRQVDVVLFDRKTGRLRSIY